MDNQAYSPLKAKSRNFGVRIIKLYNYIKREKKEYILTSQLLRSGTSIGANLAESEYGSSKKDFLSKIYISLKECSETLYWLDLLHETDYLTDKQYESMNSDCLELLKMLKATAKTTSDRLEN